VPFEDATNLHNVGIQLSYNRSVADTGGLGGASLAQMANLNVVKDFGQKTSLRVGLSYGHFKMLGLTNPITLVQQGLNASITRKVSRSVDVTTFFVYAKSAQGLQGAPLLNHNQLGITIVYLFPRVPAIGGGM